MYLMQGVELKVQNYLAIQEDSTWRTQPSNQISMQVKNYYLFVYSIKGCKLLGLVISIFTFVHIWVCLIIYSGQFSIMINSTYYRNQSRFHLFTAEVKDRAPRK